MSDSNAQLGDKLGRLAENVLDDLLTGEKPLDQRIDGLKAVGALYLGLKKHSKDDEPPEDGSSLNRIRDRVKAAEGEGK